VSSKLSISQMAEIHTISRQTLIYYDKIGLFQPDSKDAHGYRYYSPRQIPFLREICFLKSIGVPLDEIKRNIKGRDVTTALALLTFHEKKVNEKIDELLSIRSSIENRLSVYKDVDHSKEELYRPVIEHLPERRAVFVPFNSEVDRPTLHLTMMRAWRLLHDYGIAPSGRFGTLIKHEMIIGETPFSQAGVFIEIPDQAANISESLTLPSGSFACMYKYGMPYDLSYACHLLKWIANHQFETNGPIIDVCLLDATFYENEHNADLCQLQIPIH
jgi:DNA-binding transcriptional MerR regulator/effector-binding domain-containing protein